MSVYIPGMEMPTKGYRLILVHADGTVQTTSGETTAVPVPPHGRCIDADKIGLTDFEIILCQKGNPFKNALEMLLEKIENAPTIIPADGKDIKVPTRKEGK